MASLPSAQVKAEKARAKQNDAAAEGLDMIEWAMARRDSSKDCKEWTVGIWISIM